jgi:class 3 adenylate cyclase
MAAAGLPALTSLHGRGVRFVPGSLSLVSRLAGVAAARRGDRTDAAAWFTIARRDAALAGAAGERARTDLDEVRLLGRDGTGPTAAEALASAASVFDHLGMLPSLRRCEATAVEMGLPSSERLGKVVLFTDLVGSTALNAAAGDRRYVRLLRTHDRVVRELLQRHDGVEFKHTGDGLAAWFSSARRAVRCALDLHRSVALAVDADFGLDVRMRCGLAAGDPIEDAGDLFGLSVTRAARLCAQAGPGEVLVSAEVLPMVGDAPVAFTDRGLVPLRGIPDPTHVFAAAEPVA